MMPPQAGGSPPLMAVPEHSREPVGAPAPGIESLTALLWCYALAAGLALVIAQST